LAPAKKYNIDPKEVEKLASYGCTKTEVADFYGCNESLIRRSYGESYKKGLTNGKIRLRQCQRKYAYSGNAALLIWLGKQELGQTDKVENEVKDSNITVRFDDA